MKRNLPPLGALKVFESAARNLSFNKAASELCVTQSAVSKQIKLLEDYLGEPLFTRHHQNIKLIKKSAEYYNQILLALDLIESATNSLYKVNQDDDHLTIHILPSLGQSWILPLIKNLKQQHPSLNVQIICPNNSEINYSKMDADIAITISNSNFENIENEKIIDEEMVLICSPALLESSIKNLSDIKKQIFLKHISRSNLSNEFIQSAGIDFIPEKNIISFEHFFMIIEAAKKGLGVSVVPKFLVAEELQQKTLVNPFNISYKTGFSYYLLYPKPHYKNLKNRKFGKILLELINSKSA